MNALKLSFRVRVDVTNPGQFFACCGLLELADRASKNAMGKFIESGQAFMFEVSTGEDYSSAKLLSDISRCKITSSLTSGEIERLRTLLNTKKTNLGSEAAAEKSLLTNKWNSERIQLGTPFNLLLDWWTDDESGSGTLKTWAGKQFITDIIEGVFQPFRESKWAAEQIEKLFTFETDDGSLPFYFDATIGGHSSSLDVGFSLDALSIRGRIKPAVEFLALIGLQRFKPAKDGNTFQYRIWMQDLPPILAAALSSGGYSSGQFTEFSFPLLYRTKYLKAFLSAKPKPQS